MGTVYESKTKVEQMQRSVALSGRTELIAAGQRKSEGGEGLFIRGAKAIDWHICEEA